MPFSTQEPLVDHSYIRTIVWGILFTLILCSLFLHATHATHAQRELQEAVLDEIIRSGEGGGGAGSFAPAQELTVTPEYPAANSEVTVSLPSTITQTQGGIRWLIDGVAQPDQNNQREIAFMTGAIGESVRVTARVLENGIPRTALEKTVTPRELDIVIEAKTVVPYFYEGRTLPSRTAPVLITAIPHTEANTPYNEYTYTWSIDGKVLSEGARRGMYQVTVDAPSSRSSVVRVEVTNTAGQIVIAKAFGLVPVEPVALFYEINPLRGTDRIAVPNEYTTTDTEITLRAESYYIDRTLFDGEHGVEWRINRRRVENTNEDRQEIVLRNPTGSRARAEVSFSLGSYSELLQFANGDVDIWFNSNE